MADFFRNETIDIVELAREEQAGGKEILEGYRFEGCRIVGPAVLALLVDNALESSTFDDHPDVVQWEADPDQVPNRGTIGLKDCQFVRCSFERVGLALLPNDSQLARASMTEAHNPSGINLGTNQSFGVPFPIVVADRFFHMYEEQGRFLIDVFRWDETTKTPSYEVRGNQPLQDNIDSNPTGIVTFGEEETGAFLFKFRPKPAVSQIFGHVPIDDELQVHINDRDIRVTRGEDVVVTASDNVIVGSLIGIQVYADGSFLIGSSQLPEGMVLKAWGT